MSDLIERAEKVRDKLDARGDARTLAGKLDTPDTRVITDAQNIINELITALSAAIPDDVTEIISQLNKVTNKQPNVIANATATLGRQQQRIEELEAGIIYGQAAVDKCAALLDRIEELQAQVAALKSPTMPEDVAELIPPVLLEHTPDWKYHEMDKDELCVRIATLKTYLRRAADMLERLQRETNYLEIPYFLRQSGAVENDVKKYVESLQKQVAALEWQIKGLKGDHSHE